MDNDLERRLVDAERNEYICSDQEGNSTRYLLYQGHKFFSPSMPGNIKERFDTIKDLPCRDDDVLMMTYPKSGTHWLGNIVTMVVNGNTEYSGTPSCMEYIDIEPVKNMPSPRILHSSTNFKFLPTEIKQNKSKIITLIRNPKDVIVSSYTFVKKLFDDTAWYHGTWEGFFKFYMSKEVVFDTWFDHIKMWGPARKEFPDKEILFLSFEDLKEDLYENVQKINKFLGLGRTDEFCREVAASCTFSNMKKGANNAREDNSNFTNVAEGGILPVYRKGEVGDWKNWFTVAQNEIFDRIYEEEMKDVDLSDIYQLP